MCMRCFALGLVGPVAHRFPLNRFPFMWTNCKRIQDKEQAYSSTNFAGCIKRMRHDDEKIHITFWAFSITSREVVNNVSCPRQQYFIMMLSSHFANGSQQQYCMCLCACGLSSFRKIFVYGVYIYFFDISIDKWLTQKEVHRQPNYIRDDEPKRNLLWTISTQYIFIRCLYLNWYLFY